MRILFASVLIIQFFGFSDIYAENIESLKEESPEIKINWLPEKPEQGDAIWVFVEYERPVSEIRGRFIDKDLIFFPWDENRWMAFAPVPVGARIGNRDLSISLSDPKKGRLDKKTKIRLYRHDFDESALRVDPRFIKPPADQLARIRNDRELIRESFSNSADERLWRLPFTRSATGRVTGRFGTRRTFNGEIRSRHMGLDLDGRTGDPIYAMTDGVVVLVHDLYYAGRSVFLDHGHEFFTVYFHMTDMEVEKGDLVRAGQKIGTIGATGRVTGPHLHLGVRIQGRYVNPQRFLEFSPEEDPKPSETETEDEADKED